MSKEHHEYIWDEASKEASLSRPPISPEALVGSPNTYTQKAREWVRSLVQQIIAESISGVTVPPNTSLQESFGHQSVDREAIRTWCSKDLWETSPKSTLSRTSPEMERWCSETWEALDAFLEELNRMIEHTHYPFALHSNDTYVHKQRLIQERIKAILTSTNHDTSAQKKYLTAILEYLGLQMSQSYRKQSPAVKTLLMSIYPEWEWSREGVDINEILRRLRWPKK